MGMESFGGNPPQQQEKGNEQKKSEIEASIAYNREKYEKAKAENYELKSNSPYAESVKLPVDSVKLEQGDKTEKYKEELRQNAIGYTEKMMEILDQQKAELEKELSELG